MGKAKAPKTEPYRAGIWSDYQEPTYIPGPSEGMVFFGAQPGWSPDRESQKEIGCKVCGGLLVFMLADPRGPVLIPFRPSDYDPDIHGLMVPPNDPLGEQLCMGCRRWAKDNAVALKVAREFARRGTVEPVPVSIPEGAAVPHPLESV